MAMRCASDDHESGRKGTNGRKQFAALFEDAHKRKFDCVLFWALDRFTREGMVPTIMHLQRLASYGVASAGVMRGGKSLSFLVFLGFA
jgi:DNA invertase Pin-like site-specific DNA recombinase